MSVGSQCGEVQCIMGNGHMAHPCGQTDTTVNITFATSLMGGNNAHSLIAEKDFLITSSIEYS